MSRPKVRMLVPLAIAAFLSSCSLVSLESMVVTTAPSTEGEIVAPEGPIRVAFSIEPEHVDAENALNVGSAAGTSSGDFRWSGSELSYYPVPPLKKGYLWTLSVSGNIKAKDGRSFDVDEDISFYAGSSASLVTLDSYSPEQGASVSTTEDLALGFSRAVDQTIFKRNFSLSPSTDYDVAWSTNGKTVAIVPKTRWTTLSTYTWQVKADLADAEGVCMARAYDGSFVVQAEGSAPSVFSLRPALYSSGALSPLDTGLDQLGYRDAIYIGFSEEVTLESVVDAIGLTPTVKGCVLRDGRSIFAFVPEEGFAARTKYRLCVSSAVADLAGNTMSEDYIAWFSPRVADMTVSAASVSNNDGSLTVVSGFGDAYNYGFDPTVDGTATISVEFNVPIADAARRDRVVTLMSCSSLFPSSALSPSLTSVQWAGLARLELTYAGFSESTVAKTNYYKFLVPGGTSGITDGVGGTMEKDLWFVIFTQ